MPRIAILEDRLSYAADLKILIEIALPDAEIDLFSTVDSALDALTKGASWDVWVVDLMMASGDNISADEAENGLATGRVFIQRMIDEGMRKSARIVVVTSRNTDDDDFPSIDSNIIEFQKSEATQVDIAKEIASFF